MKRKGTIILAMLLVFVIEVCLIYTLKGKMDTLLQFTKIFFGVPARPACGSVERCGKERVSVSIC